MTRRGVWVGLVLANLGLLFFALNPWIVRWADQAAAVLILEVLLVPLVLGPVVAYQMLVRKRTFRDSLTVAAEVLGDLISGLP